MLFLIKASVIISCGKLFEYGQDNTTIITTTTTFNYYYYYYYCFAVNL